jgi:hypothetical protein
MIHKELIPQIPDSLPASQPIDNSLIECFREIITLSKNHGSRLIIIVSPIYYKLPDNLQTMEIAKSICAKEHILFLDYSQSPQFLDHGPEMFLDKGHLNDSSAIVFSTILSGDLLKIQ